MKKRKSEIDYRQRLRDMRKKRNLVQAEFAAAIEFSKPAVQNWETERLTPPKAAWSAALCFEQFGVNPNRLLARLLELSQVPACEDGQREDALAILRAFDKIVKKGSRLLAGAEGKKAKKKSPRKA